MKYAFRFRTWAFALAVMVLPHTALFAREESPYSGLIESDSVRRSITSEWLSDEINRVQALKGAEISDQFLYRFSVTQ